MNNGITTELPYEKYIDLTKKRERLEILEKYLGKDKAEQIIFEAYVDKEVEAFLEYLNEILIEADVEYPAGWDAGHKIDFDEVDVKEELKRIIKKIVLLKEKNV